MKGVVMKKSCLLLSFLAALMLFQGCAFTKSKISFFEEKFNNDREALVYVYRLKSMVGASVSWNVRIDDKVVGVLKQGAYMVLHISPGVHTIKIGESGPLITGAIVEAIAQNPDAFRAKENEIYYVRSGGFSVEFATKEKAMRELPSMKYDMGK